MSSGYPSRRPGPTRATLTLTPLEERTVPAGVPILHSLPDAPVAIYLDFDGQGSNTPYDIDGNPSDFNPAEVADITEAHGLIATYFAIFNVDVTTEFDSRPKVWHVTSNSVNYGYALKGTFPSGGSPKAFNPSSDARSRRSGIAHEIGHVFGLSHQSDYDLLGNKVNAYSSGFDERHGKIMGVDYARNVRKFVIGRAGSASSFQNDLGVIASQLADYGGDGYRPDDYGNTFAAATPLARGQTVTGIIERRADKDAFSFTTGGPVTLSAVRVDASAVDLRLTVYTADGVLVAEADPANSNDAGLTLQLTAGTYYAVVSGHGDYHDQGVYTLRLTGAAAVAPPTYNSLPAPPDLTLGLGTGSAVTLSWGAVAGATGYRVLRSADGVTYNQIGTTAGATTFTDARVSASQRWFYQVQARSGSTNSPPASANIVNRPAAPFDVTLTRLSGGTTAVLNWRDVAGDNGYRVERSTNGVNWTQVGTVGANVPGFTQTGVNAGIRYLYRVIATSPQGDSVASVVVATDNALGVHATAVTDTAVTLEWSPVVRSRYRVERSTDGVNYTTRGTVTGGATTYTDSAVAAGQTYTYRVMAEDTSDGIASSPWSYLTVTTPGAPPAGVADGGFEAPGVGAGTFEAFQYNPSGSAWTFTGAAGVSGNGSGFTDGNPAAPEGAQVAFLQGQWSSASQSVSLAAGTYTVTFRAAQRGNYQPGGDQTVRVRLAGAERTVTPAGTAYDPFEATFTVSTAGTYALVLDGTAAGDATAFLDDILLTRVG